MQDPNDAFFAQFRAGAERRQAADAANRHAHYESQLIKKILSVAGHPAYWAALQQSCYERTDSRDLNFTWFHEYYPGFPVTLGCEKVRYVHKTTFADLFRAKLPKATFFRAYHNFLETRQLDDTKDRVGFIFDLAGVGTMLLHNYPRHVEIGADADGELDHNTRIVRPYGRPVVIYVIEELRPFLDAIGRDWLLPDE